MKFSLSATLTSIKPGAALRSSGSPQLAFARKSSRNSRATRVAVNWGYFANRRSLILPIQAAICVSAPDRLSRVSRVLDRNAIGKWKFTNKVIYFLHRCKLHPRSRIVQPFNRSKGSSFQAAQFKKIKQTLPPSRHLPKVI
jgi:hypothetical protein